MLSFKNKYSRFKYLCYLLERQNFPSNDQTSISVRFYDNNFISIIAVLSATYTNIVYDRLFRILYFYFWLFSYIIN